MKSLIPLQPVGAEIIRHHADALKHANAFCESVIAAGRLLLGVRAKLGVSRWGEWLDTLPLSRSTAYRYVKIAEVVNQNPERADYHLERGNSLVDLLRDPAFGLVRPCLGGGYRSETYQRRKLLADHQMDLPFQYEDFEAHVRCLITSKNVSDLADSSLEKLDHDLTTALARIREIKSNRLAIAIPAS